MMFDTSKQLLWRVAFSFSYSKQSRLSDLYWALIACTDTLSIKATLTTTRFDLNGCAFRNLLRRSNFATSSGLVLIPGASRTKKNPTSG